MKVLVVEDEDAASRRIIGMIQLLIPEIEVLGPLRTVDELRNFLLSDKKVDCILSDIRLADGNSMDIYDKYPSKSPIIFTTAYDEFALQAFQYNSIHYLLKPIEKELLAIALKKVKAQTIPIPDFHNLLSQMAPAHAWKKRFLFKLGTRMIPVECEEIACFIAENKTVHAHLFNLSKYICELSLDGLENVLDPAEYFRLNRSTIVQRKAVEKVHTHYSGKLNVDLKIQCKNDLSVSKEKAASFKNWLS